MDTAVEIANPAHHSTSECEGDIHVRIEDFTQASIYHFEIYDYASKRRMREYAFQSWLLH